MHRRRHIDNRVDNHLFYVANFIKNLRLIPLRSFYLFYVYIQSVIISCYGCGRKSRFITTSDSHLIKVDDLSFL